MKTIDIIEKIKTRYLSSIERYDMSIKRFKKLKSSFSGLTREELRVLSPNLVDYDLAIDALIEKKYNFQSKYDAIDFNITDKLNDDLDFLVDTNPDITHFFIEIVLEFLFELNANNIIENEQKKHIEKVFTVDTRKELGIYTRNEIEYKLSEALEAHDCSKESIRLLFKTIKDSLRTRLPKEPISVKNETIKLGETILDLSS